MVLVDQLHDALSSMQLRFANPLAEQLYCQYEARACCKVDRLAWGVLLVHTLAAMIFIALNPGHEPSPLHNVRFWVVPAVYLLLLGWSSLRQKEYVAQRKMLILSARLIQWPSTILHMLVLHQPAAPESHPLSLLFKTALLGAGLPVAAVMGIFLRVDLPTHALFQLWTISRYCLESRAICASDHLQQEAVGTWLWRIERHLGLAGGMACPGLVLWGNRAPSTEDRCFAFLSTVQLVLGWALPVYVAYLLDRSSRRRWVRTLAARERQQLGRPTAAWGLHGLEGTLARHHHTPDRPPPPPEQPPEEQPREQPMDDQQPAARPAREQETDGGTPAPPPQRAEQAGEAGAQHAQQQGPQADAGQEEQAAAPEELRQLVNALERAYWGTYDLLAINVTMGLLVLPLCVMIWRAALALALQY